MTDKKATKVLATVAAVVVWAVIVLALFFAASFGTMLLVGALHSAVPVVPAISFFGASWVVILGMWFRALFGSPAKNK
ncbi:hypothetical protein [Streptomyces rubiginosohelvolus]|uniref:hypothetical protein n=1 Tax=Streptomyces rubiginosohelvolus TaxID=67362 RepID=UPI0033B25E95